MALKNLSKPWLSKLMIATMVFMTTNVPAEEGIVQEIIVSGGQLSHLNPSNLEEELTSISVTGDASYDPATPDWGRVNLNVSFSLHTENGESLEPEIHTTLFQFNLENARMVRHAYQQGENLIYDAPGYLIHAMPVPITETIINNETGVRNTRNYNINMVVRVAHGLNSSNIAFFTREDSTTGRIGMGVTIRLNTTRIRQNESTFIRGDANNDQKVDVSDAVTILYAVYFGQSLACEKAADVNDDGQITIEDRDHLSGYLMGGTHPAPSAPFPEPGLDPTPDNLLCD